MRNLFGNIASSLINDIQKVAGKRNDDTSERAVYSKIYNVSKTDPYKAKQLMSAYQTFQITPTSKYYNPYAVVTNRSVNNLASYGIDTSNIDDNFFQKYDYLRNYLRYDGTTNTPSKPGVKASNEEKAAYEFYQIWNSEDATRKAENQWAALQKEVKYWASAKDRNYSDDEILANIDWSKYDELVRMDENKKFKPNEYNRVIGYSKDALYAAMWEARNPTFNGSIKDAMVNSYLGLGNKWTKDESVSEKLNPGSDKYSPYSVGSTMDAERAYFGVDSFDQNWVNDNRTKIVTGSDPTAKKYFENIRAAVDYTEKLKTELKDMKAEIDDWLATTSDADDIISLIRDNSDYKDLFALDDTLISTNLKATASAVDYRWSDIEEYIRSECNKAIAKTRSDSMVAGIIGGATTAAPVMFSDLENAQKATAEPAVNPRMERESNASKKPAPTGGRAAHEGMTPKPQATPIFSDTDIALDEAARKEYEEAEPMIRDNGTKEEKISVLTGDTILRNASVAALKGFQTTVEDFTAAVKTDAIAKIEGVYGENYDIIRNYENKQADIESKQAELDSIATEFSHLSWKVISSRTVGNLNDEQLRNLMYFSSLEHGDDPSWDVACDYIKSHDEADEDYDTAVTMIYTNIVGTTPEWAGVSMEEARENVKIWLDYMENGEEVTTEELDRYNELSRWRNTLYGEIREAQDYLDANERAYNNAKKSNDFTELIYNRACLFDQNLDKSVFSQVKYIYDTAATDIKYQYAGYYGYDVKVQEGEMSVEDAALASAQEAWAIAAVCDSMNKVYSDLKKQGVNLENSKSVENQIASYEDYGRYAAYASLDGYKDFDVVVSDALGDTINLSAEEGLIAEVAKTGKSGDRFNTATEFAKGMGSPLALINSGIPDALYSINQQEAKRYFYVKETEGDDAAKEYLNFLLDPDRGMLTVRHMTELQENLYNFASNNEDASAFLAVPATIALSVFSWVEPVVYRVGQAISGKDVSPYNAAYSAQVAEEALKKGSAEAVRKSYKDLGVPDFIANGMGQSMNLAYGSAKYAIGSEMVGTFFKAFGVDLNNLASGMSSPTLTVKLAKTAAEVAIPTINDAESKYRQRTFVTNNQEALAGMYAVDFASGLVTHSVIMNGLHADFEADGSGVASRIVEFFKKILRTDSAVGVSTFLSSGAEAIAEKALMGANSEWQKNVDKYRNEYHYPLAVAQQMADQQMWADVNEQMWGAIVQSTIRTGIQGAVSFVGSKIENGIDYVNRAIRNEFKTTEGIPTYDNGQPLWDTEGKLYRRDGSPLEDDNGNQLYKNEIDPDAFMVKDPGYDKTNGKIIDSDGKAVKDIPEGMIPNQLGGTVMIDRKNGTAFEAIGYVVDDFNHTVKYVSSNGDLVPLENILYGGGQWNNSASSFQFADGTQPTSGSMTQREYGLIGETWDYLQLNNREWMGNYYIGDGGYSEPITINTVAGGASQTTQPVVGFLPSDTMGRPVEYGDSDAKALQITMQMYDVSPSAATTGMIALLGTGDDAADTAAGEIIVGDLAFGDSRTVAMVFAQAYQTPYNNEEINVAVVDAALTNGEGNEALHALFDKTKMGQPITSEDVNALISGVNADRMRNPKAFDAAKQAAITGQRVADETVRIASQNTTVSGARAALEDSKAKLQSAQKDLADAEEEREAVIQNAQDSITTLAESGQKADVGPVQQTVNQADGADNAVSAAEDAVAVQERKVAEAEQKLKDTENQVMTEARQQAQETVAQQQEAEKEESYNKAVANIPPIVPLGHIVRVPDSNGKMVNITGVYDRVASGNFISAEGLTVGNSGRYTLGQTDEIVMYTTDDGRLVMGNLGKEDRRGNPIRGYGDVDTLDNMELANAADKLLGNNRSGSGDIHPDIHPVAYFPSSFPVTVNGKEIQMIGVSGKMDLEDWESPVIMGIDGSEYVADDLDIPFEYVDVVNDVFYSVADNLEPKDVPRIAEVDVNAGEAQSGQNEVSVPGDVGTGDNQRKLASEPQPYVGRGNNSDVKSGTAQGEAGRGEESQTKHNGSNESRVPPGLRRLISSRLASKGATDLNLEETDYERFSSALNDAKSANEHGMFVDAQSVEDLQNKGAIVLMSPDGMAGVAISKDGDIVGVFKNPNSKSSQASASLIINAIAHGGNKLDCYDGKLTEMYSRVGMIPVARVAWNDSYHQTIDENGNVTWSDGWDYDRDGTPDIIVWMHNGDSAATVAQRYGYSEANGGYHVYTDDEIANLIKFDDVLDEEGNVIEYGYDRAKKYRDGLIENGFYNENDLAITHTLSVDNAVKTIKNGGFPAPSLAVGRKGVDSGVASYGNDNGLPVTVVFGAKTINPENPKNIVYSRDGGTNVFPEEFETTENGLVWADTKEPASLEDVVNYMFPEGEEVSGSKDRTYSSLEEIIQDIGRIVGSDSEAIKGMDEEFKAIYREIMSVKDDIRAELKGLGIPENEIKNIASSVSRYYASCGTYEEARNRIANLGVQISDGILSHLEDLYNTSGELLSRYMEAKPMRVVPLDESLLWIVPDDAAELKSLLSENNIPYKTITDESEITDIVAGVDNTTTFVNENKGSSFTPTKANSGDGIQAMAVNSAQGSSTIGINRIIDGLILSPEEEEDGTTQLYDAFGNRFGYTYEDKYGTTRVGLSTDGGYDTPEIHKILGEAGFVLDPKSGEWMFTPNGISSRPTGTQTQDGNKNSSAMPSKTTKKPVKSEAAKAKEKLDSPQEIFTEFLHDIGVADYRGTHHIGDKLAGAGGYFEPRTNLETVKANRVGDTKIEPHEGGHSLFAQLNISATDDMVKRLEYYNPDNLDLDWYRDNGYSLRPEAEAAFFRAYIEDEAEARAFAGDEFYEAFENELARHPQIYKATMKARDKMRQWLAATAGDKIGSVIKNEKNPTRIKLKSLFSKEMANIMATRLFDDSAIAEPINNYIRSVRYDGEVPAEHNVRRASLLADDAQARATSLLSGVFSRPDGTLVGDSLLERMLEAGFEYTDENMKEVDKALVSFAAIERNKQGKDILDSRITMAEVEAYLEDLKNNNPTIYDTAKAVIGFWKDVRDIWLVDEGLIPKEMAVLWDKMYENYAPMQKVGTILDNAYGFPHSASSKFRVYRARGGTGDIFSPFQQFIIMTQQVVKTTLENRAAQAFDEAYNYYGGMGKFARLVPDEEYGRIIPKGDFGEESQITDILKGQVPDDVLQKVLNITRRDVSPTQPSSGNILNVYRRDGSVAHYELANPYLYRLLAGITDPRRNNPFLHAINSITRTSAMLITGMNPGFTTRNLSKDYQNGTNYGTWTPTYIQGLKKWLSAYREIRKGESDAYKKFVANGGGGYTRYNALTEKGANEIMHDMFGYDTTSVKGKLEKTLSKVVKFLTAEKLNARIEQTSRFVEFKHHDLSTPEGIQDARLASREVTVDFNRSGAGIEAAILRAVVPFFNPAAQGVYRTARQFTQAERGANGNAARKYTFKTFKDSAAAPRLVKSIVNPAILSALAIGAIILSDDETKEQYNKLSDQIKKDHLILPNPLRHFDKGQDTFIRIPLSQDSIGYAVNSAVTNLLWKGTTDEWAISLAATVDAIVDVNNPYSGTVFQPFIDASHHKTWFGSNTIRYNQRDWVDRSVQYNEDTADFFKWLGRVIDQSPEDVEYVFKQMSGYIGELVIPAITPDKSGKLGGLGADLRDFGRKWTTDASRSTTIITDFKDMKAAMQQILESANNDRPQNLLRVNLTQQEVDQAYLEAEQALAKGGVIYEANNELNQMYKDVDDIYKNSTLTSSQQAELARKRMMEGIRIAEAANDQMLEFYNKYVKRQTVLDHLLDAVGVEGQYVNVPTNADRIDDTFKNDSNAMYMQRAMGVYNGASGTDLGGGKTAALPHPDRELKINNQKYTIADDEWGNYTAVYKQAYEKSLKQYNNAAWNKMSDTEKYQKLKNAHTAANKAMRLQYAKDHGIKIK